jgi:hypothetical protein
MLGNGKMKDTALFKSVYDNCNTFFKASGLPRDFGFDLDYIIAQFLFTYDTSKINFQDPHINYSYVTTRRNLKD